MRRNHLAVSMLAVVGALTAGLIGWEIGRAGKPVVAPLDALATDTLGERLMARVGKRFVADNRQGRPVAGGSVTFYDQPRPYDESFCWTTAYTVPTAIVEDRAPAHGEPLGGNVEVVRLYGAWKAPTSPDQSDSAGQKACAAYRDFQHMFREANPDAGTRGAYLLDTMITRAKIGRLDFPGKCVEEPRDSRTHDCDMIALLTRLTFNQISYAETKASENSTNPSRYTDELTIFTGRDRGRETVTLTVVSTQFRVMPSSNDVVELLNAGIVLRKPQIVSVDAVVSALD